MWDAGLQTRQRSARLAFATTASVPSEKGHPEGVVRPRGFLEAWGTTAEKPHGATQRVFFGFAAFGGKAEQQTVS